MKKIILALCLMLSFCATSAFAEGDKLNLNVATVEQLANIEGITQQMAEDIIEARTMNEEFVDFAELLDIEGIDNALLRKLDKVLFIEPAASCAGC